MPRTNLHQNEPPSIGRAALHGLCPRCGAQTVFDDIANFHSQCGQCRLDFSRYEPSGRFAAIVTLFLIMILIGAAMLVDEVFHPPLWLQLSIWAPLTVVGVIFVVRYAKSGWLALRYAKAQLKD